MVSGINSLGITKEQYNAFLERNRKHDKLNNALKYGAAGTGVTLLGAYAANSVINNPNTSFVKGVDKSLTRGAEFFANGEIKDVSQKAKKYAGEIFTKIENKIPENKVTNKLGEIFSKAKNIFNKGINKAKEFVAPLWNKVKGPVTNVFNKVKTKAADLLTKFAKMPGQYKVAGLIGALVLGTLGEIVTQKAYNDGKIDEKYTQVK